MMKSKKTLAALALVASLSVASTVSAVSIDTNAEVNTNVGVGMKRDDAMVKADATSSLHMSPTGSAMSDEHSDDDTNGNATGAMAQEKHDDDSSSGSSESENHRSVVATFVKSLLAVADREGGIGAQVREVARAQNDSSTTTVSAMAQVESRGSLRTFFFGSDYHNLGVIRSEIANTDQRIARLQTLLSHATDASDKTELSVQIKALQDEQVKVNAYVKAHEDTFSLFGWFNKWISN